MISIEFTKCDRACKNQPCERKKIADFFCLCSIITYQLFVQAQLKLCHYCRI